MSAVLRIEPDADLDRLDAAYEAREERIEQHIQTMTHEELREALAQFVDEQCLNAAWQTHLHDWADEALREADRS